MCYQDLVSSLYYCRRVNQNIFLFLTPFVFIKNNRLLFLIFYFLQRSQNLPSSFRLPRWFKLAGVGIILTAGLGSLLVFLLVRMRRGGTSGGGSRFS